MKQRLLVPLAALMLLTLCTACDVKGNDLPDGMEEDAVLSAGLGVMDQLIRGEYDEICEAMRSDVRETTSASALKEVMDTATDGLGAPEEVTDTMVTGVTDTDEPHAIAVIRRKYEKKSVYFRIAFDPEMQLIGLDVKKR